MKACLNKAVSIVVSCVGLCFFAMTDAQVISAIASDADETNLMVTADGVTYSNVTFGTVTPVMVSIRHSVGIASVPLAKLQPELQKRLGYDPQKATEYQAAQQQGEIRAAQARLAKQTAQAAQAEQQARDKAKEVEAEEKRRKKLSNEESRRLQETEPLRESLRAEISSLRTEISALETDLSFVSGGKSSPAKSERYSSLSSQLSAKRHLLTAKTGLLHKLDHPVFLLPLSDTENELKPR